MDKKLTTDRILKPREELIKEIKDNSNVDFWMYNLPQFLYNANKYLKSEIKEDAIHYFSNFLNSRNKNLTHSKGSGRNQWIPPEYQPCDSCDGERNYVEFRSLEYPIINEYPESHPDSKFNKAITGNCNWCNTLHIICPKCGGITGISEHNYDEKIECEGGCGSLFCVDTSNDYEYIGEYDIVMKDNRVKKCVSCGDNFVENDTLSDCCEKCEEEFS